ncbi:MAG: hypothetical protein RL272_1028 [Candidatus Parcubacteria bacterium]|jgi:hypothetical protein
MSRRAKIVIAAIVILLLLLLGALFFLRTGGSIPGMPEGVGGPPASGNAAPLPVNYSAGSFNANVAVPVNQPAPVVPKKPDDRASIKVVARTFAEMYGSFSTEGNYQNIVDSEFYMSDAFRARSEAFVADARSKPGTGQFAGTTTRAVFEPQISALDAAAGTATALVKTQRRESGSTVGGDKVYYQDLKLEFVKKADTWKVDSANWMPR